MPVRTDTACRHGRAIFCVAAALLIMLPLAARGDDPRPTIAVAPRVDSASDASLAPDRLSASGASSTKDRIQELIRQLGHRRYTVRRAAASELRQIGPESFDLLHAATGDADPEVAASARYLLRQISVRWVHNEDTPAVRALLRGFGELSDESRLSRLEDLGKLAAGEGVAALCRIARYDRSPLVSRTAALAIIRPDEQTDSPPVDQDVVDRELGESRRDAAVWLRRYSEQLREPAAAAPFWEQLVDEETNQLKQYADDTSPEIVLGLLWNLGDVYRQLNDEPALLGVIDRMVGLDAESSQQVAIDLVEWLIEHQSWQVLDEFFVKHQATFEGSKRFLYNAALARERQGQPELAEELAAKAAQIDSQTTLESVSAARDLEERGQFEWAVREYHRAIDNRPVGSHESIIARVFLASMLHDYEKNGEAADVLEPLVKAVQNEGRVGQLYAELLRYYRGRLALPEADAVAARFHYYRAGQHRQAGDRQRERGELELAIKFDHTDADVLIAMYRLPEADSKWREMVRQRIRDLCREFQQEIDENPSNPTPYNQWAWLVSNTEGDYQKAIRYSHRSLELIPPGAGDSAGASFLDTLGRCYYAAGDLENAVKYQRKAIEKIEYMQVMHRQLALFEKALEERAASSEEREAEDSQ